MFCTHILFIILLKLRRRISCTIFSLSANNNWKIRYTTWHFWCYLSSNIINRRTKHIQLLDTIYTRRKVERVERCKRWLLFHCCWSIHLQKSSGQPCLFIADLVWFSSTKNKSPITDLLKNLQEFSWSSKMT